MTNSAVFFRIQLIWIYTVCKSRAYPGSAGPGLMSSNPDIISHFTHFFFFLTSKVDRFWCSWEVFTNYARGVWKLLQMQPILDNHRLDLYKTNTCMKWMTDHYCTLCIYKLEIHKLVLLQFRLLSDVLIDTALKMVRKWIENVAEIRGYILQPAVSCDWVSKAYIMWYVLFMGINKCYFPQFICGLQNSVPVRNQSKCPLFRMTQVCSYQI